MVRLAPLSNFEIDGAGGCAWMRMPASTIAAAGLNMAVILRRRQFVRIDPVAGQIVQTGGEAAGLRVDAQRAEELESIRRRTVALHARRDADELRFGTEGRVE